MLKKPVFWVGIATVVLIGIFVLLIMPGFRKNNPDDVSMHTSGGLYDVHFYTIGTVLDLIQEDVKVVDSVKYKTIGYRVMVLVPLSDRLKEYDLINVYAKYKRNSPADGPEELSAGDIVVVSYFINALNVSEYPYTIHAREFDITYATYDYLEKYKRLWNGKADGLMDAMINVPDDFSIAFDWENNGRSKYDGSSGELIKEYYTYYKLTRSDYTTHFFLSDMSKAVLYMMIREMNLDNYPDVYDPYTDTSIPTKDIVLTVKYGDYSKTIRCYHVWAYDFGYNSFRPDPIVDEAAEKFNNLIKTIGRLITSSKEWKALPEFEFMPD